MILAPDLPAMASTETSTNQGTVLLVVGAFGGEEYGSNFVEQAQLWQTACAKAGCRQLTLGLEPVGATNDHDRLQQTLAAEPKEGSSQLWLVLIGHGTFDGKQARFNLRGPDVSDAELAGWLQPFRRPLVVIDTSSSSAPFLAKLSGTNRVIVTATRSGHEQNFARFGQYFAKALTAPEADLDKDGQVSVLEAFLAAASQTAEFYKLQGRLATEHPLLDDNGDGQGTPADWFRGLQVVKQPKDKAAVDGLLARQIDLVPSAGDRQLTPDQRAQRDRLERAVLLHRERKAQLPEDEYYRTLEKLLLDLATFYEPNRGETSR
jgi:hypothetical protein